MIKSRRIRWAGHVARIGEKRNEHRILVGKPEGKRPLGRQTRRCVDNIKADLISIPGRGKILLCSTASRWALGPTQPSIPLVLGGYFEGLKRPGREADHSPYHTSI
jgi:hypothetical protein